MLTRALAILMLLVLASLSLSYAFGAEVLAALGMIFVQLKIIFGKLGAVTAKSVVVWLKAQGVNFARVEVAKRWFLKSLLPLIIGASMQRRISAWVSNFAEGVRLRKAWLMAHYQDWPPAVKVIAILCTLFAILALSLSTMSLWLLIFSVQVPIWILAATGSLWRMIWLTIQKLLFRTIAFMQLYRIWGFLKRRLPDSYLRRKRQFDFKVARIVVRKRRMTVAQLHAQKDGLAMRIALIREYFRHKRPERTIDSESPGE